MFLPMRSRRKKQSTEVESLYRVLAVRPEEPSPKPCAKGWLFPPPPTEPPKAKIHKCQPPGWFLRIWYGVKDKQMWKCRECESTFEAFYSGYLTTNGEHWNKIT